MSRAAVDTFLAQPAHALAGVSRSGKKFGNLVRRALQAKGHRVYPIHRTAAAAASRAAVGPG
jgi:predicted CoA-binding protein